MSSCRGNRKPPKKKTTRSLFKKQILKLGPLSFGCCSDHTHSLIRAVSLHYVFSTSCAQSHLIALCPSVIEGALSVSQICEFITTPLFLFPSEDVFQKFLTWFFKYTPIIIIMRGTCSSPMEKKKAYTSSCRKGTRPYISSFFHSIPFHSIGGGGVLITSHRVCKCDHRAA
jgi:hypothetical protein